MKQFISQYLQFILDINTYNLTKEINYTTLPESYIKDINKIKGDILSLLDLIVKLNSDIRYESNPRYMILANMLLFGEK